MLLNGRATPTSFTYRPPTSCPVGVQQELPTGAVEVAPGKVEEGRGPQKEAYHWPLPFIENPHARVKRHASPIHHYQTVQIPRSTPTPRPTPRITSPEIHPYPKQRGNQLLDAAGPEISTGIPPLCRHLHGKLSQGGHTQHLLRKANLPGLSSGVQAQHHLRGPPLPQAAFAIQVILPLHMGDVIMPIDTTHPGHQ